MHEARALSHKGCPLAVWITAPFALLGIVIAFVLIVAGSTSLTRTIEEESALFSKEFGKRIAAYLAEFSRDPAQASATTVERLASGAIDLENKDSLRNELIPKIRNYPWLSSIGIAGPDGSYIAATRSPANGSLILFESGPTTGFRQLRRAIGDKSESGRLLALGQTYDPRGQSWYTEAESLGTSSWSLPHAISIFGVYGISISTPVFDEKGRLSAVVHSLVALPLMDRFLHENLPEASALALVIDPSGRLLASSAGNAFDNTAVPNITLAEESAEPLVRAAGQAMRRSPGSSIRFAAQDKVWRLDKQAFLDPLGLALDIGVVVEEDRLARPLRQFRDIATLLVLLSALAIVVAGYFVARAISKPVAELGERAARLASGDWGESAAPLRGLPSEIVSLSRSFDAMATTLHSSVEGLEATVAERTATLENLVHEVNHRIKNTLNTAASLLALQGTLSESEETATALDEAALRIKSMAILYSRLHLASDLENVDLGSYLGAILDALTAGSIGPRPIRVERALDSLTLPTRIASPLGIIVTELFTNACKYAFPEGREGLVTVRLEKQGPILIIEVADDGVGFPEGFDAKGGGGFGLTIAGELAASMGGRLSVKNLERGGLVSLEIDVDQALSAPGPAARR
ncbi:MAG TPA: histidine kinase dimerization/phosphoacceptor domain -containing protein [Rectinemataceae bacterium]|nr:histidine kinase dimerization/phosphoacceptor domain -containing protein [Rectinemataceae bacterium]